MAAKLSRVRTSARGWHKLAHDACSACATSGWVAIAWLSNGRYLVMSLIRQPLVVVRLIVHDGVSMKFSVGGGDWICHSRPVARQGLEPAIAPYFSDHVI